MNTLYFDRGKEQLHLFSCHVHVYKVDVFYQNTWAAAYIEQAKGEGTFNRIFFFFFFFALHSMGSMFTNRCNYYTNIYFYKIIKVNR